MQIESSRYTFWSGLTFSLIFSLQACGGGGSESPSSAAVQPPPSSGVAPPNVSPAPPPPPIAVAPPAPVVVAPPAAPESPLPPVSQVTPPLPSLPAVPTVPAVPAVPAVPSVPAVPGVPAVPVVPAPAPSPLPPASQYYQFNDFTIAPEVTGATGGRIYYSDTITVTGLSPGVTIHVIATGAGYVDAAAEVLTGTYKTVVDPFEVSSSGTLVFKVQGVASATPGATVRVTVAITTYSGYGPTFQSGKQTVAEYSITTAR